MKFSCSFRGNCVEITGSFVKSNRGHGKSHRKQREIDIGTAFVNKMRKSFVMQELRPSKETRGEDAARVGKVVIRVDVYGFS